MKQKASLLAGTFFGLAAVGLGAFGSHGLKDHLLSLGRTDTYDLAVQYQFYHAFALLINGTLQAQLSKTRLSEIASLLFTVGILFFSGSLYVLALTNITVMGAITPVGGVCFLIGWAILAYAITKTRFS